MLNQMVLGSEDGATRPNFGFSSSMKADSYKVKIHLVFALGEIWDLNPFNVKDFLAQFQGFQTVTDNEINFYSQPWPPRLLQIFSNT